MQCEYCGNLFGTKSNLKVHQNNAKYCLKIQNVKKTCDFSCEYCGKNFTTKQRMNEHKMKCIEIYERVLLMLKTEQENNIKILTEKYEEQLKKKDEHIKQLEDKLENIAIKGATKSTNNISIYQNLQPLTQDKIQNTVENYSLVEAMHGGIGIAKLALKNGLSESVICTDLSRMSAKYKNEEGKVVPDPGLRTVSSKIFSSIEDKNNEIMDIYAEGKEEDDPFVKVFKLTKAAEIKTGVQQASQDDGGDIYRDFAKYVCQKTMTT